MKMRAIRVTFLNGHPAGHKGILTPDLCQLCKKPGPGIVVVRGLNGSLFSAHAWPCAERAGLHIESHQEDMRDV